MPLCCCRRRRTNRVGEAEDKRTKNQETLHYTHKIVDGGAVSVTEFTHKDQGVLVPYYYWCARFGGNAAGHAIRGCAGPSTENLPTGDPEGGLPIALGGPGEPWVVRSLLGGPWVAVAQNVDDDLTWTCPTNPAPEGFMERLRAVVAKE